MVKSANNIVDYNGLYFDKTISDWIDFVHRKMSAHYKWKYFPLKQGAFGYDNLACSIYYVFNNCSRESSVNEIASQVHDGWVINYMYWKNNEPWKTNNFYKKPSQVLGDDRRNMCAKTKFNDLPDDEKEKDVFIAEILKNIIL